MCCRDLVVVTSGRKINTRKGHMVSDAEDIIMEGQKRKHRRRMGLGVTKSDLIFLLEIEILTYFYNDPVIF